ncbi:MAG: SDR family NAD(P)-dependent oxidoreductase, partial [Frankia sp.]
ATFLTPTPSTNTNIPAPSDRSEEGSATPAVPDAGPLRAALHRLPAIDRQDDPWPADPVAVIVRHEPPAGSGDPVAAAVVTALESSGWTVREVVLPAPVAAREPDREPPHPRDATGEMVSAALADLARVDLGLLLVEPDHGDHSDDPDGSWSANSVRLADCVLAAGRLATPLATSAEPDAPAGRRGFVTISRLDGGLGYRGVASLTASLLGGVTGLVKTVGRESPTLFCRAIDLAPEIEPDQVARALLDELDDAALDTPEVGIDESGARWTVRWAPAPPAPAEPALSTADVVVVTGGGRGITADCVRALAAQVPCEFILLGRTAALDDPEWARGIAERELFAAGLAAARARGESPTPRDLERLASQVVTAREVTATLAALAAAGAKTRYLAVDLADAGAVTAALAPDAARVTTVVHGAGMLADALLPDITAAAVGTVFRPKLDGLRAVLDALADAPLERLVLFGSIAGVLGNPGQSAYAAANEALNRIGVRWCQDRDDRRATTLNWAAWDGGMVTAGLREVFLARGVPLLGREAGSAMFVEHLGGRGGERLLLGPAGALDPTPAPTAAATRAFTVHRSISGLGADPVIADHTIGEHAVLPATAALGWMANVLEKTHPDLRVVACGPFSVHRGIVFDGTQSDDYRVEVVPGGADGDPALVTATIWGDPGTGRPQPRFAGRFVLGARSDTPRPAAAGDHPAALDLGDGDDALGLYHDATLFHGPALQGIRRILLREPDRLIVSCQLPDSVVGDGAYASTLISPVLADVVIQAAALLATWHLEAGCLPLGFARAEFFAPLPDDAPFTVSVDGLRASGTDEVIVSAAAHDPDGRLLARFTDVTVVRTPGMTAKFAEAVRRRADRATS